MFHKIGALRWWAGAAAVAGLACAARSRCDQLLLHGRPVCRQHLYAHHDLHGRRGSVGDRADLPGRGVQSQQHSLAAGKRVRFGVSSFDVNTFGSLPSSPATITGAATNTGTPPNGFDSPLTSTSTSSTASVAESTLPKEGVTAGASQNGVSAVFLGTVTFQAGATNGQMTTFRSARSIDFGQTSTNLSGYDLDNNADPSNPSGSSCL